MTEETPNPRESGVDALRSFIAETDPFTSDLIENREALLRKVLELHKLLDDKDAIIEDLRKQLEEAGGRLEHLFDESD